MQEIKLEQPKIDKNKYDSYLLKYLKNIKYDDNVMDIIKKTEDPIYLHWKDLKYKSWIPSNYSAIDFWTLIKVHRDINSKPLPIKTQNGEYFKYFELDKFKEISFKLLKDTNNKNKYDNYLKSSIIEETISSSQIEGAHTTRRIAKKIILGEQKPSNTSEQMILNNYNTIKIIQEKYKNEQLSIELIKEFHISLTENDKNIEDNKKGNFREDKDEIIVGDNLKNKYVYKTPKISFVLKELENLINFANNNDYTINPIIKAIILHFWFAYLHPFVDGNGRLARCLFYWYLLRNNLDIFIYYPISTAIKKSIKQYCDSYLFTEHDGNDITYFIDYNLRKIIEAKKLFEEYFIKKENEQNNIKKLALEKDLNTRQENLLNDINLNKLSYITLTYYMNLFNITKPTASNDLKDLENKNLLTSKKVGREVRYYKNENR